jgi:hypothetical protein
MTNVIRNMILSCQYKTSSANKLVDRKEKYIFVCFCAIRNTRKVKLSNTSSDTMLKRWLQHYIEIPIIKYIAYALYKNKKFTKHTADFT